MHLGIGMVIWFELWYEHRLSREMYVMEECKNISVIT